VNHFFPPLYFIEFASHLEYVRRDQKESNVDNIYRRQGGDGGGEPPYDWHGNPQAIRNPAQPENRRCLRESDASLPELSGPRIRCFGISICPVLSCEPAGPGPRFGER